MKVDIVTILECAPQASIEIPVKSWDEIKDWYVKWDTFHYTVDGETWAEIDLDGDEGTEIGMWHRPKAVMIYKPKTRKLIDEK